MSSDRPYGQYVCQECGAVMSLTTDNIKRHGDYCCAKKPERKMKSIDELNKWAAEWLGGVASDVTSNIGKSVFKIPNEGWVHNWNPCTDRNQCWLVVHKMFDDKEYELKSFEFILNVAPIDRWSVCAKSLLLQTPEAIIRAAHTAVTGEV